MPLLREMFKRLKKSSIKMIDDYFDKVKNEVADLLREKAGSVDVILNFLMIAKYFERIGDHAENICEWVEFSKTGEYKDERIV